jgi:hypothetical protein
VILLDDVRSFVRRFVVLDDHQADTIALWAAHTHAADAFGCTPYLAITSPEKRSGKTRLLEVLELLCREPLPTANISDAALFRVIDSKQPSLLVDEVDAVFGKKSPREELRGMLNAGYRQGDDPPHGRRQQHDVADVLGVLPQGVRGDRGLPARHDLRPCDPRSP